MRSSASSAPGSVGVRQEVLARCVSAAPSTVTSQVKSGSPVVQAWQTGLSTAVTVVSCGTAR
ncbi:MAG TPA: hypothetical protein VIJ00_08670 [Nakamurella sp.]